MRIAEWHSEFGTGMSRWSITPNSTWTITDNESAFRAVSDSVFYVILSRFFHSHFFIWK